MRLDIHSIYSVWGFNPWYPNLYQVHPHESRQKTYDRTSLPNLRWRLWHKNIIHIALNPLRPIGSPVTHESWPMNWPNFAASPAHRPVCTQQTHCGTYASIFSHIQMTTRAGSLRVESGRDRPGEDISGPTEYRSIPDVLKLLPVLKG